MVGVASLPDSGGGSESDQLQKNDGTVEFNLLPSNHEPGESIADRVILGVKEDNGETEECNAGRENSNVKKGFVGTEVATTAAGYNLVILNEGISSKGYPTNGDKLVVGEDEMSVKEGQIAGESTKVDMDVVIRLSDNLTMTWSMQFQLTENFNKQTIHLSWLYPGSKTGDGLSFFLV